MCISIVFCKSTKKNLWLLFHIKILAKTSKDSNSLHHYTNHVCVIEMQITIQSTEHNLKSESQIILPQEKEQNIVYFFFPEILFILKISFGMFKVRYFLI